MGEAGAGQGTALSLSRAYRHYPEFASVAAVGAGLEVAVAFDTHRTELDPLTAGWTTTVPVAVFVLAVWLSRCGPGPVPPR